MYIPCLGEATKHPTASPFQNTITRCCSAKHCVIMGKCSATNGPGDKFGAFPQQTAIRNSYRRCSVGMRMAWILPPRVSRGLPFCKKSFAPMTAESLDSTASTTRPRHGSIPNSANVTKSGVDLNNFTAGPVLPLFLPQPKTTCRANAEPAYRHGQTPAAARHSGRRPDSTCPTGPP